MVQVPKLRQVGVRPLDTPFQNLSYTPVERRDLQAVQAAAGNIAQVADAIAIQDKERRKTTDVREGQNSYDSQVRELLHNPDTGYNAKTGKERRDAGEVTQQKLRQLRNSVVSGYEGEAAERLNQALAARENTHLQWLQTQMKDANHAYELEVLNSRVMQYADDAATYFSSTQETFHSVVGAEAVMRQQAVLEGWSDERLQQEIENSHTAIVSSAFSAAIKSGKIADAKRIFEEYGELASGTKQADMRQQLAASTNQAAVFDAVDSAFEEHPDDANARMGLMRQIKDPDIRKAAEDEMLVRNAQEASKAKAQRVQTESFINRRIADGATIAQLMSENPEEMALVAGDPQFMKQAREYVKATAEARQYHEVGDDKIYRQMMTMPSEDMAATTPEQIEAAKAVLNSEQHSELFDRWDAVRKEYEKDVKSQQVFDDMLKNVGRFRPADIEQNSEEDKLAQAQGQAWANRYMEQNGKPPTPQEQQEFARLLWQKAESGTFDLFTFDRAVGLIPQGEEGSFTLPYADLDPVLQEQLNRVMDSQGLQLSGRIRDQFATEFLFAEKAGDAQRQIQILQSFQRFSKTRDSERQQQVYKPVPQLPDQAAPSTVAQQPEEDSKLSDLGISGARPASVQESLSLSGNQSAAKQFDNTLDRIANIESSNNPSAKNPNSSASGLFQFTKGTWEATAKKYWPQLLNAPNFQDLRFNPQVSRQMAGYLMQENQDALRRNGIPVTDGSTYLAHFLGWPMAVKLMQQDLGAPVESFLPAAVIKANQSVLKGKTAQQVIEWAETKMGKARTR